MNGPLVRTWFSRVPLDDRVGIARDLLGMYRGRRDAAEALAQRMKAWEEGDRLRLNDRTLVAILQMARGWSDADLVQQAGVDPAHYEAIRQAILHIQSQLAELFHLPKLLSHLEKPEFGSVLDVASLHRLRSEVRSDTSRIDRGRDLLATTAIGLYRELRRWYFHVGEGRVDVDEVNFLGVTVRLPDVAGDVA